MNSKKNVRALSLSQKQTNIKARENCLPKKESLEPEIVLPVPPTTSHLGPTTQTQPFFYYIKLNYLSKLVWPLQHH